MPAPVTAGFYKGRYFGEMGFTAHLRGECRSTHHLIHYLSEGVATFLRTSPSFQGFKP